MYDPKLSEVCMEPVIWDALPQADKAHFEKAAVGKVNKRCGVVSLLFDKADHAVALANAIAKQGDDRLLDIVAIIK